MGTYRTRYPAFRFDQSRRTVLRRASLGAAAVGVLGVAGCGSSSNNSNSNSGTATATRAAPASGGTAVPSAATAASAPAGSPSAANIKKGGTLTRPLDGPLPTIDVQASTSYITLEMGGHVYSRLMRFQPTPGKDYSQWPVVPDAATGYELTDGGQTLTFKLRPNVRFHPPVDRVMTAQDVVFSYQRFLGTAPNSKPGPNAGRFSGQVDSITAPDNATVVVKLKRPYAPAIVFFTHPFFAFIVPMEAGSNVDLTKTMVGSGPWTWQKYDPSTGVSLKRFPQWHFGPDAPYLDGVEAPIIPDYANRLTQFLAGKTDLTARLVGQDYVRAHDQVKNLFTYQTTVGFSAIAFSAKDMSAPFKKDPRVRQAMSMALDRDGTSEAAYNFKALKAAGVDAAIRWNNFVPPKFPDYWLDPQGNKIDPAVAKYFKYDPMAAKQLLSAAGFPDGFSVNFHYPPLFGQDYKTVTELTAQLLTKIGIKTQVIEEDYASVYTPMTRQGNYDGLALTSNLEPEASMFLEDFLSKAGGLNMSKVDDPDFDQKLADIQATVDVDQRRQKILDVQNYLDDKMYYVPLQSSAGPLFGVAQPTVPDAKTYPYPDGDYGWGAESLPFWTKPS